MARGWEGKRRAQVLAYLVKFSKTYNRMPSHKEAHYDLNIERGVLNRILDSLVVNGKINRIPKSMPFEISGE